MLEKLSPHAKTGIIGITIAVSLFILVAAVNGIIGNRADALTILLWGQMRIFLQADSPLLSVGLPSGIILVIVIAVWLWDRSNLTRGVRSLSHALTHVNAMDTTLVTCAPQLLYPTKQECDLECVVRNIVYLLLKQATEAFPKDVHRAVFFRPDPDPTLKGMYLTVWVEYGGIDKYSRERKKFYIGKNLLPGSKRGIAGEAYDKRNLIVAHIIEHKDGWKVDNDNYICFDEHKEEGREVRPQPAYSSLVCVPLVIKKGASECLGVVCFDSNNPKVFDPREVKDHLLFLLAARLRAIMVIFQEVQTYFSKEETQANDSEA